MKNAVNIYRRDMKVVFTNYAVLIVVIALSILPSLYAWINIKASWDPYSESATSRIKVDVVNLDTGTDLNGKKINVGEKVIEGLRENTLLGWQFVTLEEGEKDLNSGDVYAEIIINEGFSEDIKSLITSDIQEAHITYRINEKLNAIAPKITSKGATGVQDTVSEQVISTVSEITLSMASELGYKIQEEILPQIEKSGVILHKVNDKFETIEEIVSRSDASINDILSFIGDIQGYMTQIESFLQSSQALTSSLSDFAGASRTAFEGVAPSLKEDIGLLRDIGQRLNSYAQAIEGVFDSSYEKAPEVVESLVARTEELKTMTSSVKGVLERLNKISGNQALASAIEQLTTVENQLGQINTKLQEIKTSMETGKPDLTLIKSIKDLSASISATASGIYDRFDTEIAPAIVGIMDKAGTTADSAATILKDASGKLPEVSYILNEVSEILTKGQGGVKEVEELIPLAKEKIAALTSAVDEVNSSGELIDLLNLIQNNVQERVDFLSNPVSLVEETIYPMGNYGSQMTPFYSVLAAWVGLTIMVSMLSVKAQGDYTDREVYFGKLMTYCTIAVVQALVIALGDLYLLKINCLHPVLFILGMVFTSIAFTFIVYSLVSVFGNVGKVVAIIVMILQVAGSGGTFPIQLTSEFFIGLNPFLPFTYAISILREAIGGIYRPALTKDIIVLLSFIVVSVVISIFLKKPMNRLMSRFTHKYHEGGLNE